MIVNRSNSRVSGQPSTRLGLRLGTSLGGSLFLAMLAVPIAAQAQNECGTPPIGGGTVTCSTADNTDMGVVYTAQPQDLNVVLDDGVAVQTTTLATPGVLINGTANFAVSGPNATVSTSGDSSNGVDVSSSVGSVDVVIGDVTTSGTLSTGVRANGSGAGNVSVTTNNISTAGLSARGVEATAVAGDVSVSTGAVMTTGDQADAINALSTGGDVAITTSGAVSTTGDQSIGINAVAPTGAASVNSKAVTTTGMASVGIVAVGGSGGTDVVFTDINTSGDFATGVLATSTGGNVSVTGANVTATGASSGGVDANSDTGDVTVSTTGTVASTGADGFGLYATSATGDATINADNVSTVAANAADTATSRAAIVATGANAQVTVTGSVNTAGQALNGGIADAVTAIGTAGNANVSVNNVTASGDTSRAVVVNATQDAGATINGAVSATGAVADAVAVTGGDNATVNIGSGGTLHATDGNLITISSVNGGTVNNAGVIVENSGGYAIEAFGGPLVINNSGQLSSDIVLTPGDDSINNSGTFIIGSNPDFGAGNDVFANSGAVILASGAVTPVSATLAGLETFNNSGLIDLRNNVVGDQLTLPGTYSGSGVSQLGLDVNLGNGTTIGTSDVLIVDGAATGSTNVLVNIDGNSVFSSGVTIVQAGAGSSADAFNVAPESINSGLVRYQVNYDPTNSSYSLAGGPNDAAFRTLNYAEGARNLWLKSADVVSAQLRARRDALWALGGGSPSARTWVQVHGSVEKRDGTRDVTLLGQTRSVDTGFKQDYFGGQVGVDLGGSSGDRGGFAFGVTGGYISSAMKFASSPDSVNFSSVNGGVYGAYTSGNFFVNALGKYDYYWADVTGRSGGFHKNLNGASYGARGEVGMRFGSDSFFVEPAASLSYVHTKFDDFSVIGTTVDFDSDDGLRGRFGGRVGGQFALGNGPIMAAYVGGNYIHEFQGKDRVTFSGGGQSFTYQNPKVRDYGEAVLGLTIGQSESISGFMEASYIRSFSSNGGNNGIEGAGGRAGLRFRF